MFGVIVFTLEDIVTLVLLGVALCLFIVGSIFGAILRFGNWILRRNISEDDTDEEVDNADSN